MMKTILIAGGAGYIGSHLYSHLEEQYSVTSIDSGISSTEKDFISLDITDIYKVNDFAKNCDCFDILIFLVGLAHAKGKGKDLPEFNKVNYQTLVNLFSALDSNNKIPEKIIFASTISVYGEQYNQSSYNENLTLHPFSPYAVTKLQGEGYLLDNFAANSWILRFAPVYFSDFLLNINRRTKAGGNFYRVGKGNKKLSLCNIENIKTAIDGIIEGSIPPGIYNLSDAKEYTYNDLLTWYNAARVIRIPKFVINVIYLIGKMINNTFLKENTIKLISDNVFPSDKIRSYIDLPAAINDLKFGND